MKKNTILTTLEKNPPRLLAFGFFVIIVLAAALLSMPISSRTSHFTPYLDSLFTATSAMCVTGLTVVPTFSHWSVFGQVIIILLIQIGGLGVMTMSTIVAFLLGKRIRLRNRVILSEQMGASNITGIVKLMHYTIIWTFVTEAIGAFLLSFYFVPRYGFFGIFQSFFHSISAFCNAGFDIIGNSSVADLNHSPWALMILALLIVSGGIGFAVSMDIYNYKHRFSQYSLHSKVVLVTTAALLVSMTLITYLWESQNPLTLGPLTTVEKWFASFFQSATLRTAGYSSISQKGLYDQTALLSVFYMFIGGSPASTAGGIKTTTFALFFITCYNEVKGREDIVCFHRRIDVSQIKRAVAVVTIAFSWIVLATSLINFFENASFLDILFEEVSAFATVGLSRNLTTMLSDPSRLILIISMYLGRVGTMTVIYAFAMNRDHSLYKEAKGQILIG